MKDKDFEYRCVACKWEGHYSQLHKRSSCFATRLFCPQCGSSKVQRADKNEPIEQILNDLKMI